ncbi:MAG: OmpA family protein [Saprospiraceae bacterium]|nr:OmpA family protein [Saprospiraceae bacterium]
MIALKHIFRLATLVLPLFAFAQQPVDEKVTLTVQNETAVNTEGLEFSPTFFQDGIVFISTNTVGLKKEKDKSLKIPATSILRSRRTAEGQLGAPEPFSKELTSAYNEGPVCFDRTAETVYFSTNNAEKGKPKLAKDREQKMRLYTASKSGNIWTQPAPLPFNTGEFDDMHPAISIDGDKLFFSSNRPGGQGGMDLWVSYLSNGTWGEPVNLGPGINTGSNEVFPFIHADNTLYFSSNGLPGEGGLDMFYVIPEGNAWTKPVNIGPPFNTAGDDLGLIVDLNKINGYYSSNGAGGKGGDELLSFHTENGNLDDYLLQNNRVPDRDLDLLVTVLDKATGAPIPDAKIHIINYDVNNVIGRDEEGNLITIQNVNGQDVMQARPPNQGIDGLSDKKGRFSTEVKPGNYAISVDKEGFQPKQLRAPISKPGNQIEIQLDRGSMDGKVRWSASVFNTITNAPMAGTMLVMTNSKTGQKDTLVTDANGVVDHYLNPDTRYKIDMYQGGRIIGSTEIDTSDWDLPNQIMMQNISVAPMLTGSVIDLPNIYYNFNDATLRPDARKDLKLLAALLQQQPAVKIEIASHTDCRGSASYNQELSQRRANGVVDYLATQGIGKDRLKAVGYGESEPRNRCTDGVSCTESEHARNRRTEMRILSGIEGASFVLVDGKVSQPQGSTPGAPGGKVNVTSAAGAEYHVVAGSFLMPDRAKTQLDHVQQAGFPQAQIVQFPNSQYYSVSVGSFASRKEADNLKKQLQKAKIDAFVRAKNQ